VVAVESRLFAVFVAVPPPAAGCAIILMILLNAAIFGGHARSIFVKVLTTLPVDSIAISYRQ
jgi:hypothetical protein